MKTIPDLSNATAVVAHCDPALRAIRQGLSHGVQVADSIRDYWFRQTRYDPCHWSYCVRLAAYQHMEGLVPSSGWELGDRLPLAGLEVYCAPLVMRVWKARGDGPPPPGISRKRNAFCQQRRLLDVGPTEIKRGNLIVDWSLGEKHELVLAVSRPTGSWRFGEQPMLDWRCPVHFSDDGALAFRGAMQNGVLVEDVIDPADLEAADGAQ